MLTFAAPTLIGSIILRAAFILLCTAGAALVIAMAASF